MVSLQETDPEKMVTRETKDRLWVKVSLEDYSARTDAYLTTEPALALTGNDSKDEFLEAAGTGFLAFSRGRVRVKYASGKNDKDPPTLFRATYGFAMH